MPSSLAVKWHNHSILKSSMLLVFSIFGFAVLFWVIFKSLGVEISMFRAESGMYLINSDASPDTQREFVSNFMLKAYNGHFAPVVFVFEFVQAKLFQAHGSWWFLRQMFVLSLLAVSIAYLAIRVSRASGSSMWCSVVIGISTAVFFVIQPIFLDLVAWPFMAFQILCIALMGLSCFFVVRFCLERRTSDFAGFLFSAYATMHMFGVGVAISAAALGTAILMMLALQFTQEGDSRKARSRVLIFLAVSLLTAIHALIMMGSDAPQPAGAPSVSLMHTIYRYGILFEGSISSSLKSLWANGGYVWPRLDLVESQGVYGVALFVVLFIVVAGVGARYVRHRESVDFISFCLLSMSLMSLAVYVALIIFRLRVDPNDEALLGYMIGGRYLIFPTFFLIVMMLGFSLQLRKGFGYLSASVFAIVAIASLVGTVNFSQSLLPSLWPHLAVSHQDAWNSVVEHAKKRIADGEFVENTNLDNLGVEFSIDVKSLRLLLERQLGCEGCVKFAEP